MKTVKILIKDREFKKGSILNYLDNNVAELDKI